MYFETCTLYLVCPEDISKSIPKYRFTLLTTLKKQKKIILEALSVFLSTSIRLLTQGFTAES